jgi:hypothetical protein
MVEHYVMEETSKKKPGVERSALILPVDGLTY